MKAQPEKLQRIVRTVLDVELDALRGVADSIAQKTYAVNNLTKEKADRARAATLSVGGADPALMTGKDILWWGWANSQIKEMNRELAALNAEREEKLLHARNAFGRVQALDALIKRTREHAKKPGH